MTPNLQFSHDVQIETPRDSRYITIELLDWERLSELVQEISKDDRFWHPSSPNFWLAISSAGFALFVTASFTFLQDFLNCIDVSQIGWSDCASRISAWPFIACTLIGLFAFIIGCCGRVATKVTQTSICRFLQKEMSRIRQEPQFNPESETDISHEIVEETVISSDPPPDSSGTTS